MYVCVHEDYRIEPWKFQGQLEIQYPFSKQSNIFSNRIAYTMLV